MESRDITVLLVTGSTRAASASTAALRGAATAAPPGVSAIVYDGLADLPPFVPDTAEPGPAVAGLRDLLAAADAVLFSTPEYAGTLPGALENLLDWTAGTGELHGEPVAVLVPGDAVSAEGVVDDPGLRARLGAALGGLANSPHVRRRLAG